MVERACAKVVVIVIVLTGGHKTLIVRIILQSNENQTLDPYICYHSEIATVAIDVREIPITSDITVALRLTLPLSLSR